MCPAPAFFRKRPAGPGPPIKAESVSWSELPLEAQDQQTAVVAHLFYPVFLRLFRLITGFHGLIQDVFRLQVQRNLLEVFLDEGVEGAVTFEQGEEGGHRALVLGIGPYAPALAQIGGDIALQAPVVGVFDGAGILGRKAI